MVDIKLSFDSGEPIYKQIGNFIKEGLESGQLKEGDKLPTVRELASSLGLAKGTAKHAYDELAKLGIVEMQQGRGTFIAAGSDKNNLSRKERAMELIDSMLMELHNLSFSNTEIEIFLKLKLSEWETEEETLRIAIVDCNQEALNGITEQIEKAVDAELYKISLDDLLTKKYTIGKEVDLVVTTYNHGAQIDEFVEDKEKLVQVVLAPSQRTVVELAKLPEHAKVGICCISHRFYEIAKKGCANVNSSADFSKEIRINEPLPELEGLDALVVPAAYAQYCAEDAERILRMYSKNKPVITYDYLIDEGSMRQLKNYIRQIKADDML